MLDEKIIKKLVKTPSKVKMQVGMDFWWLLDGFWMDFGRVLGAKLGSKSNKNVYKIDMEIWLTIWSKNEGGGGWAEKKGDGVWVLKTN